MSSVISVISKSKVAPASGSKQNSDSNGLNIVRQSSFLIYTEALLGIDRIYLLQYNKLAILSKIYSLVLLCVLVVYLVKVIRGGATHKVILWTLIGEYILFVLITLTSNKNKLKIFFKNLSAFDSALNIQNDLAIISSKNRVIAWTLTCIIINAFEVFMSAFIYDIKNKLFLFGFSILIVSHDVEQVFFFTYLRDIYMRMLVVRAHAMKLFNKNIKLDKLCQVEKLSRKSHLDVNTLHRVYELLHKCSQQLNSTLSIPVLLVFFVSSLLTINQLKNFVAFIQMENPYADVRLVTFYVIFRCLKYTILVVIPCYYSSVTAALTTKIRSILHDALNTVPMSKIERRKVKTFFHLTRESDFSYAICGVIKLDMSLPLSYISLCTTYLVIIIQFSKFID